MALVPKQLLPKICHDLHKFIPQFESIWKNLTIASKKQVLLNNDIHCLKKGEREKLCTVTIPYGLQAQNNKEPTRISNDSNTQTLTDYLICEPSLFEKVFACDTNLKSNHFGVVGIFNCYAKSKQPRLIIYIHDKSNYKK